MSNATTSDAAGKKAGVIPVRPARGSVPFSFTQERLLFLSQFDPDSVAYSNAAAIRLTGPLGVAVLERSINEIIARHEILRTTFATVDGRPVQVIAPTLTVTLPVTDLSDSPPTRREADARRLATEEAWRPFDLARGPLVRARLLRIGEDEHVLIISMHRIISDARSLGVLAREVMVLYGAFAAGRPSPLAELPIQYADFALWQREWLTGEVLEEMSSYWRRQLSGAAAVLELPTDRPRPARQSYRGTNRSFALSESLSKALRALSRREGATLFMTLLAAFQALLTRYTGQEDIVVGTPVAGRGQAETEELIGFFVNTLALRTDASGNPSFRELLRRVREVTLGAYEHQDVPFEKLVEELKPARSLSHAPLFQVTFALHNTPEPTSELSGLTMRWLPLDLGKSDFDLSLFMCEGSEGLSCLIEYNTDLFDAATIERMGNHFQVLLQGIIADPGARLSELPLLTDEERHQLLVEWNDTQDYPKDKCIHQLFEAQAKRTPEAVAVIFGQEQLTYAELNRRANQVARYLQNIGVKAEALVGILVERSAEMIVGLLGILKAGGAYVPLDPAYPEERLRFMLEDAAVKVLVTQASLVGNVPAHDAKVVRLDADWERIADESAENPAPPVGAENLAYVIYTSGSTGQPKGVAIEHHSAVTLLHWAKDVFSPTQLAGVLASTSICFDLSVFELFVPLSWGGTVVLAENALRLPSLPAAERVTLINTVPSAIAELLRMDGVPASVATVNLAGEPLPTALVREIYERGTVRQVFDLYGPSEDTTYSTYTLRSATGRATIGRPVASTQVYIVDRYLQPVPIGVPGELLIGGAGLARGYLNRPELTAEKFIPHPFSGEASSQAPGARVYRTGDLARYLADGQIEYLGRMDTQVKVRGFRIELGEVEAVLSEHPGVRECVVVVRGDAPGDKRLVAFVVPGVVPNGGELTPGVSELRSFLKEKLPEYMVPRDFVPLHELPLTPNGKVDRRALSALDLPRPNSVVHLVAARDELESQLIKLWEKVLGVQPVGVYDDFFESGGDSLLAARLFAQIGDVFGHDLPLATLFQAPTVEQLADVLRRKGRRASWSSLVAIQPGGSKPPFFGIHGAGANVLVYRVLAQYLGADQPVYGLQSRGLDGKAEPSTRVEEMAAHYINEIRAVQPRGPYYLGGISFGGVVAFEMARQLHAQGERVALLAMFNSDCPGPNSLEYLPPRKPFHSHVYPFIERVDTHLEDLRRLGIERYLLARARAVGRRTTRNLWKLTGQSYSVASSSMSHLPPVLRRVWETNLRAEKQYLPQLYPGRITFFWASERASKADWDARLGWIKLAADGIEIHAVPGDHATMRVEPHVRVLAEKLRACLHKAQEVDFGKEVLA